MKKTTMMTFGVILLVGWMCSALMAEVRLGKYKTSNPDDCMAFAQDEATCTDIFDDDRDADGVIDEEDDCSRTPFVIARLVWANLDKSRLTPEAYVKDGIPSDITIDGITLRYVFFDREKEIAHVMLPEGAKGFEKWTSFDVYGFDSVIIPGSSGDQVRWLIMDGQEIVFLFTKVVDRFGCAPGELKR